MSTVAIPGDFTSASHARPISPEFDVAAQPFDAQPFAAQPFRARALPPAAVRRRANLQQGRALENIGHAIEYLVDSRLFITSGLDDRAEHQAIQILMRASRAVFAECAEVLPLRRQLALWIEKRLPGAHRPA